MKYFTKEWYNKMQNTGYHYLLKIDERANEYSEPEFKKLYIKEKVKYEKNIPQEYSAKLNTFEDLQEIKITKYKNNLPLEILQEIQDIRIFALGYTTKKIYNEVKKFCEDNANFIDNQISNYNQYFKETFASNCSDFLQEDFHDCTIISCEKKEDDYTIKLDNTNTFSKYNTIILKNAQILKSANIIGSIWLYEEYYQENNKYEIQILLRNANELQEITISFSNMILKNSNQ